jgi:hypothetical protein
MSIFNSSEKITKKWLAAGIKFIAENDRVYDNILSNKMSSIDKDSSSYLSGKFLFRTFGVTFVITGVNIERRTAVEQGQQEINQEDLDVLHEALSSFCGLGTNDVFSIYETEHGIKLDEIPLENIEPLHGRGAEFMDESLKAFIFYCHQPDPLHVSDELVKLYCEALSHSIKDLDQKSFVPQAMATFSAARKAIGIKI